MFIGTTELILICGIALLLFGGKKLPEMMRGLGQGVKQFKEGMKEIDPTEEEKTQNPEQDAVQTEKKQPADRSQKKENTQTEKPQTEKPKDEGTKK